MQPFSFKENILSRSVICILFGFAAGVAGIGALTQAFSPDGILLLVVPGILSLVLMVALFWFFYESFNNRQFIAITPEQISVRSRAHGSHIIQWHNLARVSETPLAMEKIRGVMPIIELMISYYLLIPLAPNNEKRSIFSLEARDGIQIVLREHLIYPHRLEQLRQAATLYAPVPSRTQLILKSNNQN